MAADRRMAEPPMPRTTSRPCPSLSLPLPSGGGGDGGQRRGERRTTAAAGAAAAAAAAEPPAPRAASRPRASTSLPSGGGAGGQGHAERRRGSVGGRGGRRVSERLTFARERTLIFFDWDDTLMPTSWLQSQGLGGSTEPKLSALQQDVLHGFERQITELLALAKEMGKVVVVTNATIDWVTTSCCVFMPALEPVLHGVEVVSARTATYNSGVRNAAELKKRAFSAEVQRYFKGLPPGACRNIISIGVDSELMSLRALRMLLPTSSRTKSVKLIETPTASQLLEQQRQLLGKLEWLVQLDENKDATAAPTGCVIS